MQDGLEVSWWGMEVLLERFCDLFCLNGEEERNPKTGEREDIDMNFFNPVVDLLNDYFVVLWCSCCVMSPPASSQGGAA